MTMMRRLLSVLAGLCLISTLAEPATAQAQARYTFFQFNMAGNMNHFGQTDRIVPAVVGSITRHWPTAVSLNEVCENQFAAIYWIVNAQGGGYHGHFAKTVPTGACNGHAYGLALLIKKGVAPFKEELLANVGGAEPRKVICGTTNAWVPRLKVCSSHFYGPQAVKYAQMEHVATRHLIPAAQQGQAVAFLGDTYLTPDEMLFGTAGLFKHTALGNTHVNPNCTATPEAKQDTWDKRIQWVKACEAGQLRNQFDYVMVANARNIDGHIGTTEWSDHLPVHGAATFG